MKLGHAETCCACKLRVCRPFFEAFGFSQDFIHTCLIPQALPFLCICAHNCRLFFFESHVSTCPQILIYNLCSLFACKNVHVQQVPVLALGFSSERHNFIHLYSLIFFLGCLCSHDLLVVALKTKFCFTCHKIVRTYNGVQRCIYCFLY